LDRLHHLGIEEFEIERRFAGPTILALEVLLLNLDQRHRDRLQLRMLLAQRRARPRSP
jgi:hypothetical protein